MLPAVMTPAPPLPVMAMETEDESWRWDATVMKAPPIQISSIGPAEPLIWINTKRDEKAQVNYVDWHSRKSVP
jgi:hypothetical protein